MRWERIQQIIVLRELEQDRTQLLRQGWKPTVDLFETADGYVVAVELPGMSESDFELHVTADSLTVRGRRPAPPATPHEYLQIERPNGPFQRRFTFPQPIDASATLARFTDGVLTIDVPKVNRAGARRVDIS